MKIGSTIPGSLPLSAFERTQRALARSLERLSSGRRVSGPKDDIAAFSQSSRFESQSRGLRQMVRGMTEAQSTLEFSSGIFDSQLDLISRMREIALSASSSSLSAMDRANLAAELKSLVSEFSRLGQAAPEGGLSILTGVDSTASIDLSSPLASDAFREFVGTGAFQVQQCFASGSRSFIKTGDLNTDGNIDVVTFSGGTSPISIYLGDGMGRFSVALTAASGGSSTSAAEIIDMNGDGILDLALILDSAPAYLAGNGDGTFRASVTVGPSSYSAGVFGDFTGDGVGDFAGGDLSNLWLLTNDGSATFSAPACIGSSDAFLNFEAADFNNDGTLDLAVLNDSVYLYQPAVYLNLNASFTESYTIGASGPGQGVFAGDFNGDGKQDFIHADTNYLKTYLGNGAGSFSYIGTIGITASGGIAVGDINNDGLDDVVSMNRQIYLANPDGTFRPGDTVPQSDLGTSNIEPNFLLADFDEDGVLDFASSRNGFSVARGRSKSVSAVDEIMDIPTPEKAQNVLKILDRATEFLRLEQSKVNALHSRLDSTTASQSLLADVIEEARDNLLQADFALETAEVMRLQILQDAQSAIRAQSTISLTVVLKLLDGLSDS